jgi:hypothetical protein
MQEQKNGNFNKYRQYSNEQIANKARKTEHDGDCVSRKMTEEERKEFGLN